MALPTLDATFASAADLPRRQMLAQWLVNIQYSGSVADYWDLPERYLWAKIAVAAGASKTEADYISLPTRYVWKDIYDAVSGTSAGTIDWSEKQALGHIAAAYRGDTGDAGALATYIDWPWRYQVASIIVAAAVDVDAQAFVTLSGATDIEAIDQFVKGVKDLGLWSSMVSWPLRSTQNAGTGTTAYSLGGLGTYNGTLTNGPSWTADGVSFDGINDYITFDNPLQSAALSAYSLFAIFDSDQTSQRAVIGSQNSTVTSMAGIHLLAGGSPFQGASNTSVYHDLTSDGASPIGIINGPGRRAISGNTGAWQMAFAGATDTEIGLSVNSEARGTAAISSTIWNNNTNARIGARLNNNYYFVGTIALGLMADTYFSEAQTAALYTLYKQTLGTGLGLP